MYLFIKPSCFTFLHAVSDILWVHSCQYMYYMIHIPHTHTHTHTHNFHTFQQIQNLVKVTV